MELAQIDLSKIKAIGHDGQQLGLLFDRGDGVFEFATAPAPKQALDGIRMLAAMAKGLGVLARSSNESQISMIEVDSSNIQAIGYSFQERVLQVDFLSGSRYRYLKVDPDVFERFINAPSKGRFLNREIKKVYEYRQVF